MEPSVIYSAMMTAILSGVPSISYAAANVILALSRDAPCGLVEATAMGNCLTCFRLVLTRKLVAVRLPA